jgi:hypothetical protein
MLSNRYSETMDAILGIQNFLCDTYPLSSIGLVIGLKHQQKWSLGSLAKNCLFYSSFLVDFLNKKGEHHKVIRRVRLLKYRNLHRSRILFVRSPQEPYTRGFHKNYWSLRLHPTLICINQSLLRLYDRLSL